jgi:hypothetical protein
MDIIINLLQSILKELKMLSPEMQALVDAVTATEGVEASAVVCLQGIGAQLADLLAKLDLDAADKAKAAELTASLASATAALAAAIPVVPPAA